MIEPTRFPTLSSYLAALPHGLASYPECRTKGAILRSVLDDSPIGADPSALPQTLQALIADRPPLTAWVSAVHTDAIFHAHCDLHAPTDEAMLAWTFERSTRVGRSQAYRHLLEVAGPRMLLRTGVRMHGFFQRGTELEIPELTATGATLVLSHPPHLHSRLNRLSNVALIRALIDLTGGQDGRAEMVETTSTHARYVASWK